VLHTYEVCAGGDGSSVRGVKAAFFEVCEELFEGAGWTDLVEDMFRTNARGHCFLHRRRGGSAPHV